MTDEIKVNKFLKDLELSYKVGKPFKNRKQAAHQLNQMLIEAKLEVLEELAGGTKGQRGSKWTERQLEIMSYILEYKEENGYPPTQRQIGDHFGLSAVSTVNYHLQSISRKVNKGLAALKAEKDK